MSLALADAFHATAMANAPLVALIGYLWLEREKPNAPLPTAVYQVQGSVVEHMQTTARHELTINVDAFTDAKLGPEAALAIDDAFYTACNGVTVASVSGFDRAKILCRSRGTVTPYDDAFGVSSEWSVIGWKG